MCWNPWFSNFLQKILANHPWIIIPPQKSYKHLWVGRFSQYMEPLVQMSFSDVDLGHFFQVIWCFFLGGRGILKWKMRLNISIPLVSIFFLAILNIHYDTSTNPRHSYVPSENFLGSTKRPYQGTWLVATTGCSSLWGLSSYKLVD